jgi:hypothetical protein
MIVPMVPFNSADMDRKIENQLRTHMLNGTPVAQLREKAEDHNRNMLELQVWREKFDADQRVNRAWNEHGDLPRKWIIS